MALPSHRGTLGIRFYSSGHAEFPDGFVLYAQFSVAIRC